VGFLFVLTELLSLGVMAEYKRILIGIRRWWRGLVSFGQIFP